MDCFLEELGKWGLGPRDLTSNVNFFRRVDVTVDNAITYHAGNSTAGSYVELRAEMNALTILNTCPHPLDPNPDYHPKPVQLSIRSAPPAPPDDFAVYDSTANSTHGRSFSALDPGTRKEMQCLIRQLWKDFGATILFVTHNTHEAMTLGTRAVVLAKDSEAAPASRWTYPLPVPRLFLLRRRPRLSRENRKVA
jgi:hypothetical protein